MSIAQTTALAAILWATWALLRRLFFSDPFKNLPGPPSDSWLHGHFKSLVNTRGWDFHKHLGRTYGTIVHTKGMFGEDCLYVYDPKALHHILVKDQNIYEETEAFIQTNRIIFGEGFFTSLGDRHRLQRKMLNPVFSIAHMREMVSIFYDVAHKLDKAFHQLTNQGSKEVDLLFWNTRLALELIGQSGLGYSFDTLEPGATPHKFGVAAKQLANLGSQGASWIVYCVPYLQYLGTARFRRWLVDNSPFEQIKKIRQMVDTFHETSIEILESKKKALAGGDAALEAQVGRGKDIISILLRANLQAAENERLSEEELLGQVTSLTFAATDTTSGALCRIIHLLAQHKDVQQRVRNEIREAKKSNGGNDIGYDALVSLPYLDAVCRETLRLYPPVHTIKRAPREDIFLPLSTPIKGKDGTEIHEIPIPKNTLIFISVLNSNCNPQLWGPDCDEWKPERWLNPLPDTLVNARIPGVYSHLLTFIGGGRSCIGFKFSQLEMKVVLALLLDHFEFSLSEKKIVWQMTGIVSPHTSDESTTPTLPIVISRAA